MPPTPAPPASLLFRLRTFAGLLLGLHQRHRLFVASGEVESMLVGE